MTLKFSKLVKKHLKKTKWLKSPSRNLLDEEKVEGNLGNLKIGERGEKVLF